MEVEEIIKVDQLMVEVEQLDLVIMVVVQVIWLMQQGVVEDILECLKLLQQFLVQDMLGEHRTMQF